MDNLLIPKPETTSNWKEWWGFTNSRYRRGDDKLSRWLHESINGGVLTAWYFFLFTILCFVDFTTSRLKQPSHRQQVISVAPPHTTRASTGFSWPALGLKSSYTSNTPSASCKAPSLNMFFIAAIRNWRVDPRRVKDEAIRFLRILTGSM
ncbi:hypothetical protein QBC32DRAFT_350730 [Pseudoneurospora amorphoporcata]|uniref:Uncharacterized protein n=1 Tax=Pseudoneurospora amorphoporcata TaxID=241081 RepID=A0AAN6NMU2_9PEZI|nr:hypothetical protein QBC32DRAFT_350730 [Pseudoneurospora amorphoporcata]